MNIHLYRLKRTLFPAKWIEKHGEIYLNTKYFIAYVTRVWYREDGEDFAEFACSIYAKSVPPMLLYVSDQSEASIDKVTLFAELFMIACEKEYQK